MKGLRLSIYLLCLVLKPCFSQIIDPPWSNNSQGKYISILKDSLEWAQTQNDSNNIIRYSAILTTQCQWSSNSEAAFYLLMAFKYAKALSDPKWYADVCNRAGMLMLSYANDAATLKKLNYTSNQMLDSSMYWHRQAVSRGLGIGREGTAGWGYRGLLATALINYKKSVYDSIPHYYNEAMKMAERTKDQELVSYTNQIYAAYLQKNGEQEKAEAALNKVSSKYIRTNQFDQTREDYKVKLIETLAKAETEKDTVNIINSAINLSLVFREGLMMENALKYINIAFPFAKSFDDPRLLAYTYLHAGALMTDLNNPDSARYYYKQAIKTESFSDPVGWAYYQLLKMAVDHNNGNGNDSIQYYYAMANEIERQVGNQRLSIANKLVYHRYLCNSGDLQKAGEILQILKPRLPQMDAFRKKEFYLAIHDYLAKSNRLDTLVKMKNLILEQHNLTTAANHHSQLYDKDQEYEVTKTKNKLDATSIQLNNTTKILIASIVTLAVVGLLLAYLFYLFRKNKRLSQRNELLLKEQNHRVKNNLQMISSLLSLQSQKLLSTDAKDALEESKGRINSVALLHRMLYESEHVGTIEACAYIKSFTEEIRYGAGREMKIELNLPERLNLKIEKVTSLGLIINELLTNSIKHVDESIQLHIQLTIFMKEGKFRLTYTDNGSGVASEVWMSSTSFGNQLIQMQSKQLKGEFEINTIKGFQYDLRISA
jgi:two-component sensor histidine kinase